mgnify:CR=1 FL=1
MTIHTVIITIKTNLFMVADKIKQRRLISILIVVLLLLLVPFIGMQFNNDINWKVSDFLLAGLILFATGLAIDFILSKLKKSKFRIIAVIFLVIAVLLIWAELAVGLIEKIFIRY